MPAFTVNGAVPLSSSLTIAKAETSISPEPTRAVTMFALVSGTLPPLRVNAQAKTATEVMTVAASSQRRSRSWPATLIGWVSMVQTTQATPVATRPAWNVEFFGSAVGLPNAVNAWKVSPVVKKIPPTPNACQNLRTGGEAPETRATRQQ